MRIIMISGLDANHFYGSSTRPYYLNRSLSASGAKVLHICPEPPREGIANTSFVRVGTRSKLKVVIVCNILARSCLFHADVLYVHQSGWMKALGIRLSHLLSKPVVLDMHGSVTQELEESGLSEPSRIKNAEEMDKRALAAADKIIVVSLELKQFLQTRFAVPAERLVLVPNGVDLSSYGSSIAEQEIDSMRALLGIQRGNRIVTFTCPRIERFMSNEIALKWFFEAVKILDSRRNDLTVLILGGGKIITPPSSSVLYSGFVENLPCALALSDVCVLPYPPNAVCGGVRNKALEYFAAGKPVVSTTEGIRGIQEAAAGRDYLLADNSEDFAQRIVDAISDETLALKIGSNGLALAKHYEWAVLGQKVYDTLLLATRK
jgi:glycosyltransferase involved in cell wall biosynthesis